MKSVTEDATMKLLCERAYQPRSLCFLQGAAHALRQVLAQQPKAKSTQASVPLDLFHGGAFPPDVRSSWVFVLRKDALFPAERHPNSIQRMFALDGEGAMETWIAGAWRRHDFAVGAKQEGLSIPPLVWHRPVDLLSDWAVVSFHTVRAADLVEEIGDPAVGNVLKARHYERG